MAELPSFLKHAEAEHEEAVNRSIENLDGMYTRLCQFYKRLSKETRENFDVTPSFVDRINFETYSIKRDLDAILDVHMTNLDNLKSEAEKENIHERLKDFPETLEAHLEYQKSAEDSVKSALALVYIQQGLVDTLIQRIAVIRNISLYTLDEVLQKYCPNEPGPMFR